MVKYEIEALIICFRVFHACGNAFRKETGKHQTSGSIRKTCKTCEDVGECWSALYSTSPIHCYSWMPGQRIAIDIVNTIEQVKGGLMLCTLWRLLIATACKTICHVVTKKQTMKSAQRDRRVTSLTLLIFNRISSELNESKLDSMHRCAYH